MSLLVKAGYVQPALIEQSEHGKSAGLGGRKSARLSKETSKKDESFIPKASSIGMSQALNLGTLPFNVNITIEAKDPESIKQVTELMKYLRESQRS
jgi:hypothetical protein